MQITFGKDSPLILHLLKSDMEYEIGATVSYEILSNDGSTVLVSSQAAAYNAGLKGYLDNLDVSANWADQEEGNFLIKWSVTGASEFASVYVENLVVTSGEVESGYSMTETHRLILSILVGLSKGGGTNKLIFRDINDTKDRVTEVVTRRGDRTSHILDAN